MELSNLASCRILCVHTPTSEAVCDLSAAHVFGHVTPEHSACVTALNWRSFLEGSWMEVNFSPPDASICPGYESEA